MAAIAWGALSHDMIDDLFAAELEELHLADRYEVHRILGQGGQGTVYLAKDIHIGREVAIKCAHEQTVAAESNLMSNLAHPGIPQIYDRGVAIDGTHYLVMQYVSGQRLDHYLQHTQPTLEQRIALFRDIAGAVDHAHQQGILHRDLKPSNIIVSNDAHATIIDWGLAAKGDPRSVCGSPHFAAPEQLDGQPADHRADIFALGVLLYFIISGELPYARRVTDFNEFRAVRAGLRRIPLQQVCDHAPRYLDHITQRASAPQAGARYQSVSAMLAALDANQLTLTKSQQGVLRRLLMPCALFVLCAVSLSLGAFYGPVLFGDLLPARAAQATVDPRAGAPFVGPPTADEINWDGIDWQSVPDVEQGDAAESPRQPRSDTGKQDAAAAQSPGAGEQVGLPSLTDILGDPETIVGEEADD